jgi:hypothetical protein
VITLTEVIRPEVWLVEPEEDGPTSRKRHKPEEIIAKLRQVDVLVSQGQSVVDAVRSIGVTEVGSETSCWRARSSTACGRPRS